jgi:hypothetical protein
MASLEEKAFSGRGEMEFLVDRVIRGGGIYSRVEYLF